MLCIACTSTPPHRTIQTISAEKAEKLEHKQVEYNGKTYSLSLIAQNFLQTVYGKSTYKGLSPVQVVYGWMLRPEVWKDEKMILINDQKLRNQLGIEGKYSSFSELFDDTLGYKLNNIGAELPGHMQQLAKNAPAVIELDEKVGMIILLTQGRLLKGLQTSKDPNP